MKAETWLVRCAAELQHLFAISPRRGHAAGEQWDLQTAAELIEAQRYRGLDPVQAARAFWRDNEHPARAA